MARALGRIRVNPDKRRNFRGGRALGRVFARLGRVRSRYPLEALHWLRQQLVFRQAEVVQNSSLRTAEAEREEQRRTLDRQQREQALSQTARAERSRLDAGQSRAADLELAEDWRKGAEVEVRQKVELEQRAREAHLAQAGQEAAERRALGEASTQAKLSDGHRAAFRAELEAARERAAEEA